MNNKFNYLFKPGNIRNLVLKNRIVMAPMATNFASETGGITQHLMDYYIERAKGGAGLIILGNALIDFPTGRKGATQIRIDQDRFIPGLSRLVSSLRQYGTKVAIQINHCGGLSTLAKTGGIQPVSCSPIPCKRLGIVPRELTKEEIKEIIKKFGLAAKRAKETGFDAVEIHGAHGYLIQQFMSPYFNHRKDEYGGSFEGMMKFPIEVIKEIRKQVGVDFPILFRISSKEFVKNGRTLDETKIIVKLLEKETIDAIDVTIGTAFSNTKVTEPITYKQGWKIPFAAEIKKEVNIPVIAVGVIREPAFANRIIKKGSVDFVAIGRGLIADPMWPKKAIEGKEEEIRKCISCNDGCTNNRVFKNLPICCAVNPAVGRENDFAKLSLSNHPKKVIIVGGGPAGMEAARVARLRGHKVILFEKENDLGGQMLLAAKPPGKDKIKWFIDYLSGQMNKLEVDIRLKLTFNISLLKKIQPDVLILACGSEPIIPNIPGIKEPNVITAHQLLKEEPKIKGKEIVVIGGGLVGCETAEYLHKKGNKLTIVEILSDIASDVNPIYREEIIFKLTQNKIRVMNNTCLKEIKKNGILVSKENHAQQKIEADLVVLACGAKSINDLFYASQSLVSECYLVGDGYYPGKILDAVYTAATVSYLL